MKSVSEEREREVRLGIVLYGGVSLAIYENGVAQELFRAVKGEGVYSLLKQLTDSDIVVDIMSGTSAGGINGIMLGYALANERDFKASAKLWRDDGDILRLLREPGQKDATSVLDSRGYYQERLRAAFDGMPLYLTPGNDGVDSGYRVLSQVPEIDLFVTGTDVQGKTYTVFDDQGHPVDVKDHRQVFLLSYRENRKNEFKPADSDSLAKLARVTSCFPVAFEPVKVEPNSDQDSALTRWGQLDDRASIFFLDGGVLNNKPFSYTIDAIARRTADRDVERMLFYVEPDPERFQNRSAPAMPNVIQAATDALIGIPGYQSIATDLQAIGAHNDQIQRFDEILRRSSMSFEGTGELRQPAPDGGLSAIKDLARRCMYEVSRVGQIRDRAVQGILNERDPRTADGTQSGMRKLLSAEKQRHAGKVLVESFEQWKEMPADVLGRFDVYFRMRRLESVCYFIKSWIYPDSSQGRISTDTGAYRMLWKRINHQFKVLEELQFALEHALDTAPIPWAELSDKKPLPAIALEKWRLVQNALLSVLDSSGIDLKAGLGEDPVQQRLERDMLIAKLKERLKQIDPSKTPADVGNLLSRCDEVEWNILLSAPGGATGPAAKEYCRFIEVDSCRFPLQRAAGTQSLDVIRVVRISPIDAKRAYSALTLNDKLCGNELGHFGGFMKRSWRANDIMWGRLDAVCQLIECLITPERVDQLDRKTFTDPLECKLELLFPNSSAAQWQEIRDALQDLPKRDASDTGPDRQVRFSRFWDALVRAAQTEILSEEVPRVIEAAIKQQVDWNQFSMPDPNTRLISDRQVWSVSPRRLDAAVASYAAGRLANETVVQKGWPAYFESTYSVGSESWNNDIPKPIMLEIMTTALLVVRNCLLQIAGQNASKIRSNLLYRFLLDYPLRLAYHLVRLQRTSPEYLWLTYIILLAFSSAALIVDSLEAKVISDWSWPRIVAAVGVPLGIILFVSLMIYWSRRPVRATIARRRDILSALISFHSSFERMKDYIILNTAPWCPMYPGTFYKPDGWKEPSSPPPTISGPVDNFLAQESISGELRNTTIQSIFGSTVALRQVQDIQVRVERLRVITAIDPEFKSWLTSTLGVEDPTGAGDGVPVIFESYEGTVTLIVKLSVTTDSVLKAIQVKNESFRLLGGASAESKELHVVSNKPEVFAYRAMRSGLIPVKNSELNPRSGWYDRLPRVWRKSSQT